jgi:hypothetical protein
MASEHRQHTRKIDEAEASASAVHGESIAARFGRRVLGAGVVGLAAATLVACGGSGSSPLNNPPDITNGGGGGNQQMLSFTYFQRCVNPIFLKVIPITIGGVTTNNTCAGAGCHAPSGTGGAFRIEPGAGPANLADPPDVIRQTDMYKNFRSSFGEVVFASPLQSRLLAKPLVRNILHGGGLIFASTADQDVRTIEFWIANPVPLGQDEFATTFSTGGDPATATCTP